MIRCDTEEERQLLKNLLWCAYAVTSSLTPGRNERIADLNKAMDALAEVKL